MASLSRGAWRPGGGTQRALTTTTGPRQPVAIVDRRLGIARACWNVPPDRAESQRCPTDVQPHSGTWSRPKTPRRLPSPSVPDAPSSKSNVGASESGSAAQARRPRCPRPGQGKTTHRTLRFESHALMIVGDVPRDATRKSLRKGEASPRLIVAKNSTNTASLMTLLLNLCHQISASRKRGTPESDGGSAGPPS